MGVSPISLQATLQKATLDKVIKLFVRKCDTKPLFVNGKMSPAYFMIRNYLIKHPEICLQSLLEYLSNCDTKPRKIWETVELSIEYQKHKRAIEMAQRASEIKQEYKEYSLEDIC